MIKFLKALSTPDLSKMSEFRRREYEKRDTSWQTKLKMFFAFAFGWIPAFIVLFPIALLLVWIVRKMSGY